MDYPGFITLGIYLRWKRVCYAMVHELLIDMNALSTTH